MSLKSSTKVEIRRRLSRLNQLVTEAKDEVGKHISNIIQLIEEEGPQRDGDLQEDVSVEANARSQDSTFKKCLSCPNPVTVVGAHHCDYCRTNGKLKLPGNTRQPQSRTITRSKGIRGPRTYKKRSCPRCGSEFQPTGPRGMCPKCQEANAE